MPGFGFGPGRAPRRRLGAPTPAVWRLATMRAGEIAFGTSGTSASNNQRKTSRVKDKLGPAHYSALRFQELQFWVNTDQTETAPGNAVTVQRAVEIGAATGRVLYGGANSGTVPNGSTLWSDDFLPAALSLSGFTPGADIWHRYILDTAVGELYTNRPSTGTGTPAGESTNATATSVDRLLSSGALPTEGTTIGQALASPGLAIGLASDHGPTVLVVGDSRFYGFGGDNGPGLGTASGPARMALEQAGLPHAMQARSSTRIDQFVASNFANGTNRLPAIAYVSDILGNWSTNDMQAGGRTANQILADIAAFVIKAKLINPKVRVWWTNLAPRTNNTNTPSGLFVAGAANGRDTFNSEIENNFAAYGLNGYVDIRSVCEDPAQRDRWQNYATQSTDGVHSTQAQQVAEAARIKAWADALPPPL